MHNPTSIRYKLLAIVFVSVIATSLLALVTDRTATSLFFTFLGFLTGNAVWYGLLHDRFHAYLDRRFPVSSS